ncbi:MAG: sigma-70 family RNA polymerase sigma factor [Candidatus Zixiibacteriota bacterium]|nr:MAG: sigma-70 family RNA polymerase sigma factor [candidate division Zixibacteria bacterium]
MLKTTCERKQTTKVYSDDDARAKELVGKVKQGNKRAFDELTRRYYRRIATIAYNIVNDPDEAADIAQIVFAKMLKNIWRFDEKKEFFTWIYRITVNASIDYFRKHRRHRHEQLEDFSNILNDSASDPESIFRRKQLGEHIKAAIQSLNEKQRTAFVLYDVHGYSFQEAVAAMNVPSATARWYLHRARMKIRNELVRRCPHLLHWTKT